MELLRVENVSFAYKTGEQETPVLNAISLSIHKGDFVAIIGRSGSGKSTLFHLIGCLLKPDSGTIQLKGQVLNSLSTDEMARIRNAEIGFVFQQFFLLPRATVLDNILLPSLYPPQRTFGRAREKAIELATLVGLGDKLTKLPNQLSGGEQQRVAVARALLTDPDLILADEPTGNLDTANAENVMQLFRDLNARGKTIILITHDPEIARRCNKTYRIQDGRFLEEPAITERPQHTTEPMQASIPWKEYLSLARAITPLALSNLKRNKMRAFLTMIGVTVGIAAVFAMLTFGTFAQNKVMEGYQELGANTVMVYGHQNWRRKATDMALNPFRGFEWKRDLVPLMSIFPEIERISPIYLHWGRTVHYGGNTIEGDVNVWGVNEQMQKIINRNVLHGTPLSPHHVDQKSPVCVIGTEIVERLFKGITPLDKILFITDKEGGAYPCRILGILANMSSNRDWRKPNLEIMIPFTYIELVSGNPWEREMHQFNIQFRSGTDIETAGKAVRAYFQQKYGRAGEFSVSADALLVGQMKKSLNLFSLMLATIALITLTVGGVGINNMMLVSVTERLKEIGLRKAVGATDRMIRVQFLLESTLLAAIAGVLGVGIGFLAYESVIYGASKVVSKLKFEWVFEPIPFLVSLVSILVVGVASGIVPALKAERLQVVEALRSE